MPAELIDGKAIAETIRGELKAEVDQLQQKYGKVRRPTLTENAKGCTATVLNSRCPGRPWMCS